MMGGHQLGRKKLKGKGGMGYAAPEQLEVDPVSHSMSGSDTSLMIGQNVMHWDKYTIKGTSTKLEKPYLRLTSVSSSSLLIDDGSAEDSSLAGTLTC